MIGMRIIAGFLAALGWFALILQFRLLLGVNANNGIGPGESLIRFFSYFTILTNTLAASVLTSAMLGHTRTFLSRPKVQTAVAVYITIVASVYFLILRHLWQSARTGSNGATALSGSSSRLSISARCSHAACLRSFIPTRSSMRTS
jgi:MFS superfamily sulfate permease-like transporter